MEEVGETAKGAPVRRCVACLLGTAARARAGSANSREARPVMGKASAVYVPSEPFDMRTNGMATLTDVDGSALETYARSVGSEPGLKPLAKRGFLVKGRLTNADVLLFASEPARHIARSEIVAEARFEAGRRPRRKRERLDRVFDKPLALALPAVRSYVAKLLGPGRDARGGYSCHAWLEGS